MNVHLTRASDQQCLMSPSGENKKYRIEIEECVLEITRVRLRESLVTDIYKNWRRFGK